MCLCCKRLKERIQGVVASGECEGLTYENKEEKAEFFVEAHALMGTELKMKMKDHIVKQQIKHSSWNFKGNGHWLDEQGLEDKYKNHKDKDFIIKNIKDHANTMTHPTKKMTLWEDVDYQSTRETGEYKEDKREVEANTQDSTRPAKKAKAKAKRKALENERGGGDDPKEPKLTPKQKQTIEGWIKAVKDSLEKIEQAKGFVEDNRIENFIANNLKSKVNLKKVEADSIKAELEHFKDEDKGSKFKELKTKMTNFFSDTKKIVDKVEREVNDAVDEAELEWTEEEVEGEEDEDRYVWKIRAKEE